MRYLVGTLVGVVVILWLGAGGLACGPQAVLGGQEKEPRSTKTIEEVLEEHTDKLMAIPGFVGTAQGLCSGEPCIRVFVVEKTDDLLKQIPPEIDGYPVSIEETGEFRKLDPG